MCVLVWDVVESGSVVTSNKQIVTSGKAISLSKWIDLNRPFSVIGRMAGLLVPRVCL